MRLSTFYAPTLRESPRDLDPPGQRALARAGFLRAGDRGVPVLLPLGVRLRARLEDRLRGALRAAGGQEIAPSVASTAPSWTALLARDVRSYRELPITHFAIERRTHSAPNGRAGLLGAAEEPCLVIRCAASAKAGLESQVDAIRDALLAVFDDLGLAPCVVEVPMAADGRAERWIVTDVGDEVRAIRCAHRCRPAVMHELAPVGPQPRPRHPEPAAAPIAVDTPDQRSVGAVAEHLGVSPAHLLKTLILMVDGRPLAALVPGDRELSLPKVARALGARDVALAPEAIVLATTGAPVGFAGPVGLDLPLIADHTVVAGSTWITGANARDRHLIGVVVGRDIVATHTADLTLPFDDGACSWCGAPTICLAGTELLRVDRHASGPDRASWTVDGAEGGSGPVWTGALEVPLSRALGLLAERHHDARGLAWPVGVGPFDVTVVPLGSADDGTAAVAAQVTEALEHAGVTVLCDDRAGRPGQKLADAELGGAPITLVIGRRGLERGVIELRRRAAGELQEVAQGAVVTATLAAIAERRTR